VISRLPSDEQALELWALGVSEDQAGVQQDWHGGSRRQKK